jgi:predicted lipoprotein
MSSTRDTPAVPRSYPWPSIAAALAFLVLLLVFPPFRLVRVGSDAPAPTAVFDPVAYAERFWAEELRPAAEDAPSLGPVVLAVRADPTDAADRYARKVGEGTTRYFFVRGAGRVIAVESSRLLVEVEEAPGAIVALRTGPVFGNAIRDGTGLLDLNDVPGLAEFNALSSELNRIVERDVLPVLRGGIEPGTRVTFAGCAPAPERIDAGPLLVFVPVFAEVASP